MKEKGFVKSFRSIIVNKFIKKEGPPQEFHLSNEDPRLQLLYHQILHRADYKTGITEYKSFGKWSNIIATYDRKHKQWDYTSRSVIRDWIEILVKNGLLERVGNCLKVVNYKAEKQVLTPNELSTNSQYTYEQPQVIDNIDDINGELQLLSTVENIDFEGTQYTPYIHKNNIRNKANDCVTHAHEEPKNPIEEKQTNIQKLISEVKTDYNSTFKDYKLDIDPSDYHFDETVGAFALMNEFTAEDFKAVHRTVKSQTWREPTSFNYITLYTFNNFKKALVSSKAVKPPSQSKNSKNTYQSIGDKAKAETAAWLAKQDGGQNLTTNDKIVPFPGMQFG